MRLTPIGHEIGLIDDERYDKFLLKKEQIEKEIERLKHVNIGANKTVQELLESLGKVLREPEASTRVSPILRRFF